MISVEDGLKYASQGEIAEEGEPECVVAHVAAQREVDDEEGGGWRI